MPERQQKTPCIHCAKPTARRHPILDLPLCQLCQAGRPDEYQYITKTRALDEYRLKPGLVEDKRETHPQAEAASQLDGVHEGLLF